MCFFHQEDSVYIVTPEYLLHADIDFCQMHHSAIQADDYHAGNAWHREKPHGNIACMERKRYAFHEEQGFQTLWQEEFPVWESL
ncbi:unnamed protein product [Sphagnum tenellum]